MKSEFKSQIIGGDKNGTDLALQSVILGFITLAVSGAACVRGLLTHLFHYNNFFFIVVAEQSLRFAHCEQISKLIEGVFFLVFFFKHSN